MAPCPLYMWICYRQQTRSFMSKSLPHMIYISIWLDPMTVMLERTCDNSPWLAASHAVARRHTYIYMYVYVSVFEALEDDTRKRPPPPSTQSTPVKSLVAAKRPCAKAQVGEVSGSMVIQRNGTIHEHPQSTCMDIGNFGGIVFKREVHQFEQVGPATAAKSRATPPPKDCMGFFVVQFF